MTRWDILTVKYLFFAGLRQNSEAHFRALFDEQPDGSPHELAFTTETTIPPFWETVKVIPVLQMVYGNKLLIAYNDEKIVLLSPANAPEMLALAQLTNSGPFTIRTIEFEHYYGVFKDGQLVAMAGQRIHPKP